MMLKPVSRRLILVGAMGSLATFGSLLAELTPAEAARKRRRSRKRRRKVTVKTNEEQTATYNETNVSVVVGPDGPPGPDDNATAQD